MSDCFYDWESNDQVLFFKANYFQACLTPFLGMALVFTLFVIGEIVVHSREEMSHWKLDAQGFEIDLDYLDEETEALYKDEE